MGWPGPMTHRQFLTWRAWLGMQWDRPSRADYYQMGTSAVIAQVNARKGAKIGVKDFRLTFSVPGDKQAEKPQAMEENKAIWLRAAAGMRGAKYVPGPGG